MSEAYVPPPAPPEVIWSIPPPRKKFQHNYRRHLLWFLATFVTTTLAPLVSVTFFALFALMVINPFALINWEMIRDGLWYSVPVLTILAAHEFGHYGYCRRYNVDATLPYFIPAPILTGTLGAVIRIKEPFPSKKALFDIGVGGPIAGFVVLLPFLYFGMKWSQVVSRETLTDALSLGEPLVLQAIARWHFGVLPDGKDIVLHPMAMAAWWGTIATALNLLPFGQLDGGHIAYAALGRRARWVSTATLGVVILLAFRSPSWVMMAGMLTLMAVTMGVSHPRIYDEHEPLDGRRLAVAVIALLIFVVTFTPLPIQALW